MSPAPAEFDPERIVRTLHDHGVEFIVVGGIAARLHGAARLTQDLDLVARYNNDNLRRLAAAMRELGAYVRTKGYVDPATLETSKALVHEAFLGSAEITTWDSDAGAFDVLRNIPAVDGARQGYEQLVARSSEATYAGVVVRVAALGDIVASKEWANRPKDHQALLELRPLQERGAARPPAAGRGLRNGLDPPEGRRWRPPAPGIER